MISSETKAQSFRERAITPHKLIATIQKGARPLRVALGGFAASTLLLANVTPVRAEENLPPCLLNAQRTIGEMVSTMAQVLPPSDIGTPNGCLRRTESGDLQIFVALDQGQSGMLARTTDGAITWTNGVTTINKTPGIAPQECTNDLKTGITTCDLFVTPFRSL